MVTLPQSHTLCFCILMGGERLGIVAAFGGSNPKSRLCLACSLDLRHKMKRTLIKIETETGAPPIIEVNGKRLTSTIERAVFYTAAVLLGLGIIIITLCIVLPLIGIVVGLVFALVGIGILALGLILGVAIIVGVLEWLFGDGKGSNDWND